MKTTTPTVVIPVLVTGTHGTAGAEVSGKPHGRTAHRTATPGRTMGPGDEHRNDRGACFTAAANQRRRDGLPCVSIRYAPRIAQKPMKTTTPTAVIPVLVTGTHGTAGAEVSGKPHGRAAHRTATPDRAVGPGDKHRDDRGVNC